VTARYPAATAALEHLAAALDTGEFATTLTSHPGHPPCLAVTSRHAQIGGDIHADHRAFWWSWGERIAPVTDPPAAARKISSALQPIPATRP
jgi:hypothetical protein